MRSEAELLLCCARTQLDPGGADRIRALARDSSEWDYLYDLALRHGLGPLLHRHLQEVCPNVAPGQFRRRLETHVRHIRGRNLYLTSQLLDLLELFESYRIPAMPMRGPVLGHSLYGDLALRAFSDLDILIRRHHVHKAKMLLLDRGYRCPYRLTRRQEDLLLYYQSQYHFMGGDGVTYLEIHWEILPRFFSFSIDEEQLWARLEPGYIGDVEVRDFRPEDSLLLLCVHGAKHLWERLAWICDVAQLIDTHARLDWEQVLDRARELGSERMLYLGLHLATELLGADLPDDVSRAIRADKVVTSLATAVDERLFRETHGAPGPFETIRFHLGVRERLRDRTRYCMRLPASLNAGDLTFASLPRPFSFLHYLFRTVRLAGMAGSRFLNRPSRPKGGA